VTTEAKIAAWLRAVAAEYRGAIADDAGRPDRGEALLYVHLDSATAGLLEVLASEVEARPWQ